MNFQFEEKRRKAVQSQRSSCDHEVGLQFKEKFLRPYKVVFL